ncbi:cytochrome P450 71AU50-like [Magnolia sinica]|uniref:cytochrome P450 71AU50-like n=1 Tax=Magnolia sinica TaxID=86752 RepID=UPI002657C36A|nr:cytochrome P450 71AU50-like [Magnolia sinica]
MNLILSDAMPPMPSLIAILMVALGGLWSFVYLRRSMKGKGDRPTSVGSNTRLPPGPTGIPIIGNLHMLGPLPHRDLHRLAKKYGPIMFMRLGQVPTVIVSSPRAAQLFLKTHDLVFSSRPITEVGMITSYDGKGLADAPYGPYWRNVRKLCTLRLLSNLMIDSFRPMRREELALLVQSLKDSAQTHEMVDLTMKVSSLSTSVTCRTVLGKKYTDESFDKRGFKGVIDDLSAIVGAFNIADYIPYVGRLDLQGLRRRVVAIRKVFDDFFEKIIDEHVADRNGKRDRDFIDSMLSFMESEENEFQFDRSNMKALILGDGDAPIVYLVPST